MNEIREWLRDNGYHFDKATTDKVVAELWRSCLTERPHGTSICDWLDKIKFVANMGNPRGRSGIRCVSL